MIRSWVRPSLRWLTYDKHFLFALFINSALMALPVLQQHHLRRKFCPPLRLLRGGLRAGVAAKSDSESRFELVTEPAIFAELVYIFVARFERGTPANRDSPGGRP